MNMETRHGTEGVNIKKITPFVLFLAPILYPSFRM
ncbi:hypothetical protein E2C01_100259 [Portunus trituberculatus]|uniref:Uncharacterized protein n=1 Tax=Portunus trituberculatus TaxID=210409 RepID=A0A5B7KIZ4_PORTR|nr:hypothetical protein [Portunus trituberculatus]